MTPGRNRTRWRSRSTSATVVDDVPSAEHITEREHHPGLRSGCCLEDRSRNRAEEDRVLQASPDARPVVHGVRDHPAPHDLAAWMGDVDNVGIDARFGRSAMWQPSSRSSSSPLTCLQRPQPHRRPVTAQAHRTAQRGPCLGLVTGGPCPRWRRGATRRTDLRRTTGRRGRRSDDVAVDALDAVDPAELVPEEIRDGFALVGSQFKHTSGIALDQQSGDRLKAG